MKKFKPTGYTINGKEMTSSFKMFLKETKLVKIPIEKELELIDEIKKDNNERALEELLRSYYPFVVAVAKSFSGCGIPINDLVNEGCYGLIKAIRRFDKTRGFKPLSLGVKYIQGYMLNALSGHSHFIRLPTCAKNLLIKINSAKEKNFIESSIPIETEIIAEETGNKRERIEELNNYQENLERVLSISEPISCCLDINTLSEYFFYPSDLIVSEEKPDRRLVYGDSLFKDMCRVLNTISLWQAETIILHLGLDPKYLNCSSEYFKRCLTYYSNGKEGIPFSNIGLAYNLTTETIRLRYEKGIRRIKNSSRRYLLKDYWYIL